jgi:eukaryotic-like serine/threonine-protein kinase
VSGDETPDSLDGHSQSDDSDPWLDRLLADRYRIVAPLPASGFQTYRARSELIERDFVARFITHDDPENIAETREQLDRAVTTLASLRSAHVVNYCDVIHLETASALISDYVGAPRLKTVLLAGPMAVSRAMRIARQMVVATCELHRDKIIHGCLSPENVLVETLSAGDDFVHLINLGLPHMFRGFSAPFSDLPVYDSPEKTLEGQVDAASDFYGLGALLFEMLTGTRPYQAKNLFSLMQNLRRGRIPSINDSDRLFPIFLDELVTRLLEPNPAERLTDGEAILDAIDEFLGERRLKLSINDGGGLYKPPVGTTDLGLGFAGQESSSFAAHGPISVTDDSEGVEIDIVFGGDGEDAIPLSSPIVGCSGCPQTPSYFWDESGDIYKIGSGSAKALYHNALGVTAIASGSPPLVGFNDGHVAAFERGEFHWLLRDEKSLPISAISTHRQADQAIAGSTSGRIYLGKYKNRDTPWRELRRTDAPITAIAILPTGGMYAVACGHHVELFDTDDGHIRFASFEVDDNVACLAFSLDGHLLATSRDDGKVELRLSLTGQNLVTLEPTTTPLSIGFDQDNRLTGFVLNDGFLCPIDIQEQIGAPDDIS